MECNSNLHYIGNSRLVAYPPT